MKRIYILRENEEDGRVLDALPSDEIDPNEIPNPVCPLCGSGTLVAYEEDGDYQVLTWCCLTEEDDEVAADAWYLICQDLLCPYEEQVERVDSPAGAELFNLEQSHDQFDEATGLIGNHPSRMRELIDYLEEIREAHPHRKLDAFLDEARWRYDDSMERIRRWMHRIPSGRKIEFTVDGERIKARFVTATDEMLLVQTESDGQMLAVRAEEIRFYGPQRFDEEDPQEAERRKNDPDLWIRLFGVQEYVVVRGYHLQVFHVDRFGLYHITTSDPEAAAVLGLEAQGERYWSGRVRRSQIEARYCKYQMVKVKGYWVKVYGEGSGTGGPAVSTENPEVAAALGLRLMKPIWPDEELTPEQRALKYWHGVISRDEVEEWDEVCDYQWPIPEVKDSRAGGDSAI